MRTNLKSHWTAYKIHKNSYLRELKMTRTKFFERKNNEAKNDSKQLWKLLKSWLQTGSQVICKVQFKDKLIDKLNDSDIARFFNEFFVKSVVSFNKSIPHCTMPEQLKGAEHTIKRFHFHPIDMETLNRICSNLKQASGLNNVNGKIVRDCFSVMGEEFLSIINESVIKGQFSNSWKELIMISIPKVQGTIFAEEFRPINMFNTLEFFLEMVVKH